jgi:DMSO/TMAO reductase YedYZ heme-binding membrane subunit
MTMPPTYNIQDLGIQAQTMARNTTNERMAMTLQMVAVGSMIIMAAATSVHLMKEMFGHTDHRDRSR